MDSTEKNFCQKCKCNKVRRFRDVLCQKCMIELFDEQQAKRDDIISRKTS